MKKYIKIDENDLIIDVFFEYQQSKFDGGEIHLEDTEIIKHKINDKSISNEYGAFIFKWENNKVIERTKTQIDNDQKTLDGKLQEDKSIIEDKIRAKERQIAIAECLKDGDLTQSDLDKIGQ
jgi:hypothetical protein